MRHALSLGLLLALCLGPATLADTAPAALGEVFEPYETIRLALLDDHVTGVDEAATDLLEAVRALETATVPLRDDASASDLAVDTILAELTRAAEALDAATGLGPTRDAYYELSKHLVRLRGALADGIEAPAVAYCPMIQKSWLQPADASIGNPYAGQAMPRCGSLVDEG